MVLAAASSSLLTTFDPDGKVPLSWKNTAIGVTCTWPNARRQWQRSLLPRACRAASTSGNSVDTGYRIGKRVAEEVFSTQPQTVARQIRDGCESLPNFQRQWWCPVVAARLVVVNLKQEDLSGFVCASARDSDIVGQGLFCGCDLAPWPVVRLVTEVMPALFSRAMKESSKASVQPEVGNLVMKVHQFASAVVASVGIAAVAAHADARNAEAGS